MIHDATRRPQSRYAAGPINIPASRADDPPMNATEVFERNKQLPLFPELAPADPTDVDAVLAERGKRYGKFIDHAVITQQLKAVIKSTLAWQVKKLADDQQEALDMICHKIGRIVNGDPNYADSWVDIAGYAKLVADRLEGNAK